MARGQDRTSAATVAALELTGLLRRAEKLRGERKLGEAAAVGQQILKRDPRHSGALHLMGVIALETGSGEIAVGMMSRALAQQPKSPAILIDYARTMHAEGRNSEAATAFRKALSLRPGDVNALCGLGDSLLEMGKDAEALKCYREALARKPGHRLAAHMVSALAEQLGRPDNAYVANLFDGYAGTFDKHLVETLEYRVPETIAAAVARHAPGPLTAALDIGCGTGLVAAALGRNVASIDGIDLAPAMVETARARNLYRNLAAGDAAAIIDVDSAFKGPYDLAVAGDVFVYFGQLGEIFARIRQVLSPDGLFVFTVEHADHGRHTVRSSGRFAHSEAYIAELAEQNQFRMLEVTPTILRKERHKPINGRLTVLQQA